MFLIYMLSLIIQLPFVAILILAGVNYMLFALFFELSVGFTPTFTLNFFKLLAPLGLGGFLAYFFFILFVGFMIFHIVRYWILWTGILGITLFKVIFGSISEFFTYILKLLGFLGIGFLGILSMILIFFFVYRYAIRPLKNKNLSKLQG